MFSPDAGKYVPEKLRIQTLFTQCPRPPHTEKKHKNGKTYVKKIENVLERNRKGRQFDFRESLTVFEDYYDY